MNKKYTWSSVIGFVKLFSIFFASPHLKNMLFKEKQPNKDQCRKMSWAARRLWIGLSSCIQAVLFTHWFIMSLFPYWVAGYHM